MVERSMVMIPFRERKREVRKRGKTEKWRKETHVEGCHKLIADILFVLIPGEKTSGRFIMICFSNRRIRIGHWHSVIQLLGSLALDTETLWPMREIFLLSTRKGTWAERSKIDYVLMLGGADTKLHALLIHKNNKYHYVRKVIYVYYLGKHFHTLAVTKRIAQMKELYEQ